MDSSLGVGSAKRTQLIDYTFVLLFTFWVPSVVEFDSHLQSKRNKMRKSIYSENAEYVSSRVLQQNVHVFFYWVVFNYIGSGTILERKEVHAFPL